MDLTELMNQNQRPRDYFTGRAASTVHEFYLNSDIESPDNYTEWFDIMRHAGEHDFIRIYINSMGGDLFTAIQFMRVLQETPATVVTSVEGACMSAATMVFLCADVFEVSNHSMFMFHNYSGGSFGKGGEMYDNIMHEREWSASLLSDVYKDFLNKKEIESILDNKDIWMNGSQVIERLENKAKKVKRK